MAASAPAIGQSWSSSVASGIVASTPSSTATRKRQAAATPTPTPAAAAAVGARGSTRRAAATQESSIASDLNLIRQERPPATIAAEPVRSSRISPSKPRKYFDKGLLLAIRSEQLQKRLVSTSGDQSIKLENGNSGGGEESALSSAGGVSVDAPSTASSCAFGTAAAKDADADRDDDDDSDDRDGASRTPLLEKPDWFQLAVRGRQAKLAAAKMEASTSLETNGYDAADRRQQQQQQHSEVPVPVGAAAASNATPSGRISSGLVSGSPAGLQTEVMGPPPQLPQDAAYPPLDPLAEYVVPVPIGNKKKPAAPPPMRPSAPEGYVAPVGPNGKMPYGLALAVEAAEQKGKSEREKTHQQQQHVQQADKRSNGQARHTGEEQNAARTASRVGGLQAEISKSLLSATTSKAGQFGDNGVSSELGTRSPSSTRATTPSAAGGDEGGLATTSQVKAALRQASAAGVSVTGGDDAGFARSGSVPLMDGPEPMELDSNAVVVSASGPSFIAATSIPALSATAASTGKLTATPATIAVAATTPTTRRLASARGASQRAANSISEAYAAPQALSLSGSARSSSPAGAYDALDGQPSGSVTPTNGSLRGKKKQKVLRVETDRNRRSASAASNGPSTSNPPVATSRPVTAGRSAKELQLQQILIPPGVVYVNGALRIAPSIQGALMPPEVPLSTSNLLSHKMEDKGGSNNDFCEVCNGYGRFLCCDGCPRSFHFYCMNPPLDIDEMPPSNAAGLVPASRLSANKGQGSAAKGKGKAANQRGASPDSLAEQDVEEMWFCNVCVAERNPSAFKPEKGLGPFGPLIQQIQLDNPREFQLPGEIRNYFRGVATANDGIYTDASMVRQLKVNKQGFLEDRDPFQLKDKVDKAVLCYRCGESALPCLSASAASGRRSTSKAAEIAKMDAAIASSQTSADPTVKEGTGWRKIASCDFCPLHWHIDCVDPPMISMPHVSRKWMCPAHSDHVQPKRRIPRIGPAAPQTVDLPVPSAANIGPGRHYRTRVLNNGDIDIIPDPLDSYFGAEGGGRSLEKGWDGIAGVTNGRSTTSGGSVLTSRFRYRLPEKVIRTDFWNKVAGSDPARIGDIFYVAAQDMLDGRHGARVMLADDQAEPLLGTRYRPFGQREYPRSGLDSLADIAIARLMGDALTQGDGVDYVRPSRTRKIVEAALQVELPASQYDEMWVPESSMRASLEDENADGAEQVLREGSLMDKGQVIAALTTAESSRGQALATPATNKRKREGGGDESDASSSLTDLSDDDEDGLFVRKTAKTSSTQPPQTPRNHAAFSAGKEKMSTPRRNLSKRSAAAAAEAAIQAGGGGTGNVPNTITRPRSVSQGVSAAGAAGAAAAAGAIGGSSSSALSTTAGAIASATATATPSVKTIVTAGGGSKKKQRLEASAAGGPPASTISANAEADTELQTTKHDAAVLREQYEQARKEVEQLRAVQELMRIKGPGKLLEFLLAP